MRETRSTIAASLLFSLLAATIALDPLACGGGGATSPSASSSPDAAGLAPIPPGGDTLGDGGNPALGDDDTNEAGESADAAVNPNPTVSSWLGTNVDEDLARVDVTTMLAPFDTAAAQEDANGYPLANATGTSSTDVGYLLPTGVYKISYVGTGTVTASGIGTLGGAWTTANGEQRNTIAITGTPGAFGSFLTLTVTNGASQTVTALHVLMPGFDYDTTATFIPQFLSLLAPFHAMRFMDWEATNKSTLADWTDRPSSATYGQSAYGKAYEDIVELANETGKDAWVTIPEHATSDFIAQFAAFFAKNLDFTRIGVGRAQAGFTTPFQLILENSNETWNNGFSAYATFLAAANANTTRYTGTFTGTFGPTWQSGNSDLMKVAQYEADRLVTSAQVFRQALGTVGHGDAVAPVLSGWAAGAAYSDEGLAFIEANYGDPSQYVTYIALAPYFGPADDTQTGDLPTLFTSVNANIAGMDAVYQDFAKLASQDGVKIAAYEGGQGISGATNQPIKHLAQHDQRMYDAYQAYFSLWKKDFGPSLFMHFNLAGDPGLPESIYQYGYWGSIIGVMEDTTTCGVGLPTLTGTEAIASVVHHCPKYKALLGMVPE
jgi:hypothetical protein